MKLDSPEALADTIGQVESALRGLIALGAAVEAYNPDHLAYQLGCVLTPLADQLASVYCVLLNRATEEREA